MLDPEDIVDLDSRPRRLIVVGDRVLILPDDENKTKVGLYLPQGAVDKKQVRGGTVVATGPGTALPDPTADTDEPWRARSSGKFMPMQAREGDYAIFFRSSAVEINYQSRDYVVVPEAAILVLLRDPVTDDPEDPYAGF